MSKDRLYLFDTTLRGPSARRDERPEDGQMRDSITRAGVER
jgi:hypothetical protein